MNIVIFWFCTFLACTSEQTVIMMRGEFGSAWIACVVLLTGTYKFAEHLSNSA